MLHPLSGSGENIYFTANGVTQGHSSPHGLRYCLRNGSFFLREGPFWRRSARVHPGWSAVLEYPRYDFYDASASRASHSGVSPGFGKRRLPSGGGDKTSRVLAALAFLARSTPIGCSSSELDFWLADSYKIRIQKRFTVYPFLYSSLIRNSL